MEHRSSSEGPVPGSPGAGLSGAPRPQRILVVGDFTLRPDPRPIAGRTPVRVDDATFPRVMADHALALSISVRDTLSPDPSAERRVEFRIRRLSDMERESIVKQVPALAALEAQRQALTAMRGPLGGEKRFRDKLSEVLSDRARRDAFAASPDGAPSILEEILASTHIAPGDDDHPIASLAIRLFLTRQIARGDTRVSKDAVQEHIAEIEGQILPQVEEIRRAPSLAALEAAWRGLRALVRRTDLGEAPRIELLSCSKEDLLADFEDAPGVAQSGLHELLTGAGSASPEGAYTTLLSMHPIGPDPASRFLAEKCAALGAATGATVLFAATPDELAQRLSG